jgi:hypothetical protein
MSFEQSIAYTNGSDEPLRIILEPWAEEFIVGPGQRVDILVRTDAVGILEMEQDPEGLVIYAYENCIISVMSNGEELQPDN